MYRTKHILLCLLLIAAFQLMARENDTSGLVIGRLKYSGGGDWYNDPSCIPNLTEFLSRHTNLKLKNNEHKVAVMDEELFAYPILFMTGHGRVIFTNEERERLRLYLMSGGFLYVDDDYGMDEFIRKELKNIFVDKKLVELPISHPIFSTHFSFPEGIPKIHEHDPGPGEAYALFHEGRMILFYTFNTNISDGWADGEVHGDSEIVRTTALKMGVNIIVFALAQQLLN